MNKTKALITTSADELSSQLNHLTSANFAPKECIIKQDMKIKYASGSQVKNRKSKNLGSDKFKDLMRVN